MLLSIFERKKEAITKIFIHNKRIAPKPANERFKKELFTRY